MMGCTQIRRIALVFGWFLGLTAVACGSDDDNDPGHSGVNQDATFDQLSAAEVNQFCVWAVDAQGGPGRSDCGNSTWVESPTVDECVAEAQPIVCRVGDAETCIRAMAGDRCALVKSSACSAYIACVVQYTTLE